MIGIGLEITSTSKVIAPIAESSEVESLRLTVTTTTAPTLVDGRPQ